MTKFPSLTLPLKPVLEPMEAKRVETLPDHCQYEPKWDGFRAIVFRDENQVIIQSKSGLPLDRYFPELVAEFQKLKAKRFVLDGEIVIFASGKTSFDDLQMRLHPAASRVQRLAKEIPAAYQAFDLLFDGKQVLLKKPLTRRRLALERFFKSVPKSSSIQLSPATDDLAVAQKWMKQLGKMGLDGVMAKLKDEPYHSGDRKGMVKAKLLKTADCVVAGYRLQSNGKGIAALTLGLYDEEGHLNHVGSTSSFNQKEKESILKQLKPISGQGGFTGKAPEASRWSKTANEYVPVKPKMVIEVQYDYFTQGRFRHGTKFLRWRKDKAPKRCDYEQLN